jgi:hypothetical protein
VLLSDYGYGDRPSAIHNRKYEIKRLPSLDKEGSYGTRVFCVSTFSHMR